MTGKEKCEILKKIRRDVAAANDIPLEQPECPHKGECKGTCPRCEAEVKSLENALADRKKRGLKIVVAGISAGLIALSTVACDAWDALVRGQVQGDMMPLEGDVPYTEEQQGEIAVPEGDLREADDGKTTVEQPTEGVLPLPETQEITLQGDVPIEDAK
jgi:hypothetical protein